MESEDEDFDCEIFKNQIPLTQHDRINEILQEVATKIPSLEFGDDNDEPEDTMVWSPPESVPSFYKQISSVSPCKQLNNFVLEKNSTETPCQSKIINCKNEVENSCKHELSTTDHKNPFVDQKVPDVNKRDYYGDQKIENNSSGQNAFNSDIGILMKNCENSLCVADHISLPYYEFISTTAVPEKSSNSKTKTEFHQKQVDFGTKEKFVATELITDKHGPEERTKIHSQDIAKSWKGLLDFNQVNQINFNQLRSILSTLPGKDEPFPETNTLQKEETLTSTGDHELMLRLSSLCKDQMSLCGGVLDSKRDIFPANFNHERSTMVPTKPIHLWSQLSSEDSSNEEQLTVFLDLRPKSNVEKVKEANYLASIKRILGLNKSRSDSSDSESDDELNEWQKLRVKLKERSKQEQMKSDDFEHSIDYNFSQAVSNKQPIEKTEFFPHKSQVANVKDIVPDLTKFDLTNPLCELRDNEKENTDFFHPSKYADTIFKEDCFKTTTLFNGESCDSSSDLSCNKKHSDEPSKSKLLRNKKEKLYKYKMDKETIYKEDKKSSESSSEKDDKQKHPIGSTNSFDVKNTHEDTSMSFENNQEPMKKIGHDEKIRFKRENLKTHHISDENEKDQHVNKSQCLSELESGVPITEDVIEQQSYQNSATNRIVDVGIHFHFTESKLHENVRYLSGISYESKEAHFKGSHKHNASHSHSKEEYIERNVSEQEESMEHVVKDEKKLNEVLDSVGKKKSKHISNSHRNEEDATKRVLIQKRKMKMLKEKIKENLDKSLPTLTGSGRCPSAYNTPTIYDQDASYEEELQDLITMDEDEINLLLVVTLSNINEVNKQYTKGRLGFLAGEDANCYFALLSWLLHLCDTNYFSSTIPFHVAGIRQSLQNGQLQLFVAVRPNKTIINTMGLAKNKARVFHKAITKYLSTHSLCLVYRQMNCFYSGRGPWVDESTGSSKMLSTYITTRSDMNSVKRVFNSKPGFFWETFECSGSSDTQLNTYYTEENLENTIMLVHAPLCYNPSCLFDLFTRIAGESCDLAGLRFIYDLKSGRDACQEKNASLRDLFPCLAIAVRGPWAVEKIKTIIGSRISLNSLQESPSLRSLYCSSGEEKLFYCPSYVSQASAQLARFFGGRLMEKYSQSIKETESSSSESVPTQKPPSLLVASTRVSFFLVVSSLLPPAFLGELIDVCHKRGYGLNGIRRLQINKRQRESLGLSQFYTISSSFGSTPTSSPNESPPSSPVRRKSSFTTETDVAFMKAKMSHPATVLLLQRENGLYHSCSLIKMLFRSLKEWLSVHGTGYADFEVSEARMCFNVVHFNEANLKLIWNDICYYPNAVLLKCARSRRFYWSTEVEQVCVLSSIDVEASQNVGNLLKKLTNSNEIAEGWELLGIKSFPCLSLSQAREVTPYEIDDDFWPHNIKRLTSSTVFACVLRGVNMINRVRDFMNVHDEKMSIEGNSRLCDVWSYSKTPEVAFRQLSVLFEESELFADETRRTNTNFIPPCRQRCLSTDLKQNTQKNRRKLSDLKMYSTDDSSVHVEPLQAFNEMSITQSLMVGSRLLPTIALIKPFCVANPKRFTKIFKAFLQENFEIVAFSLRLITQSEAGAIVHYNCTDYNDTIQYLTSGPCIVICLHRENAVKKLLDILGPKDPVIARNVDPFLLRGCYGVDSVHNAIHGSESYSSAISELKMFFPHGVCCKQTIDLEAEQIPCGEFDSSVRNKPGKKLTKCKGYGSESNLMSCMMQVNCVILTHHIVHGRSTRKRIAMIDVFDCLSSMKFVPVGMKMVLFTKDQVNQLLWLMKSRSTDNKQNLSKELTDGSCIVLALQRENAITCFDMILESFEQTRFSIAKHRKHMIEAKNEEEAEKLLLYLFDCLMPNSTAVIS